MGTACARQLVSGDAVTRVVDLTGQAFGRLTVVERATNAGTKTRWLCRCECGTTKAVQTYLFTSGTTLSCGCLVREGTKGKRTRTMVDAPQSPTYNTWRGIVQRCCNPKAHRFDHYGGRGITMCERWRESFAVFVADVGERPSKRHSLDRIDGTGNYEPGNVRWATWTVQMRNTSRNRLLTLGVETLPVAAWAERLGVAPSTLWNRSADGWSDERVLITPVGKYTRRAA